MPSSIHDILSNYPKKLASHLETDTPRIDVERLLCHVLNKSPSYLYTWREKMLSTKELLQFEQLFSKRLKGQPIAYLVGKQGFWNLDLIVNEHTLIPRADTEIIIEIILNKFQQINCLVLDLGTGCGTIALALACENQNWKVTAVDSSTKALSIAAKNKENYNLINVELLCGSWYQPIKNSKFDIIASNPPYIDQKDQELCQNVRRYEPATALIADDNGLADIKHIICHGKMYLKPNGFMIIEHGYRQARSTAKIFDLYGYKNIEHHYDLSGHIRATSAVYA